MKYNEACEKIDQQHEKFQKRIIVVLWFFILFLAIMMISTCVRETNSTAGETSRSKLLKWKTWLSPTKAKIGTPLETTDSKPSNVSPGMALTMMNQALTGGTIKMNYNGKSVDVPLNTIYTIQKVNDNSTNGEYYYVGLCEIKRDIPTATGTSIASGYTIKATKGISRCVGVVNARNESISSNLRTANAEGKPYKLKVHLENLTRVGWNPHHVFKIIHNAGYENLKTVCGDVTTPKVEFDPDFNVYISVTHVENENCGGIGDNFWNPKTYLLVNAATEEVTAYRLDNRFTSENEGNKPRKNSDVVGGSEKKQSQIPTWVNWVYSHYLFIQGTTAYSLNIENQGYRTIMGDLIPDGARIGDGFYQPKKFMDVIVDTSLARNGRDLIIMSYLTSRSYDLTMNSIITFNPRTGKAAHHQPCSGGMAVKSLVIEQIEGAGLMKGEYEVDDLTLHTMFGECTWEGVLVRNATDNIGRSETSPTGAGDSIYMTTPRDYATYAETIWVRADNNIQPAGMIHHVDYKTSMIMYRNYLYRKSSRRGISTTLIDTPVTGYVKSISSFNGGLVIRLKSNKRAFVVECSNPFNSELGDAFELSVGDKVHMRYGNQKNLMKSPVRIVRRMK